MKTDQIKIEPRWPKSKDEIWNQSFSDLEDKGMGQRISLRKSNYLRYAAAAAVAIILLIPSLSYFYTANLIAPKGEHLTVLLPDGSTVEVNADSRLSYRPLWWRISREVKLDGEAYFKVAEGSAFKVLSPQATVTVLGTSFNVYARGDSYDVTCLTGRVEVSAQQHSVILTPGMKAVLENKRLSSQLIDDADSSIGWTKDQFIFNGVPLRRVIEEVERQYDIEVITNGIKADYIYSGNFSRTEHPADVLSIIGRPFGLDLKIKPD